MVGERVARLKRQAYYDKLSRWYDLLAGLAEKRCREAGLRQLGAREGERVLEVGFGTGECLVGLARMVGPSGRVYGVDLSEGMCHVARRKLERAGLSEMVEIVRGDAANLPFGAGFFDAVFLSFTLELFADAEIPVVLGECRRILRDGGRIGVVTLSARRKAGLVAMAYRWAHGRFPDYVDCRPLLARQALEASGFETRGAEEVSMWGLPVDVVVAKKP